jgi:hypothetical protein
MARRSVLAATAAVGVLGLLNGAAYLHARSMTRFVSAGCRTAQPEALGRLGRLLVLLGGVRVPRPGNARTPADVGLAYETHTIEVGDGTTLEAWLVRRPDPAGTVLLYHGYASGKDYLLESASVFVRLGYTAVLVDCRGSGGSSGDRTSIGYHESRDVAASVRWAASCLGDTRPVLYGLSMGAAAALRAVAADGVRPRALVLEAPFDRLLNTVRHRVEAIGLPTWPLAELLVYWGGRQSGIDAFGHNPVDYARHVTAPTLVLHGADDARVTLAEARAVTDALAGPRRLVVLPDVCHGDACLVAPRAWEEAVGAFLSGR